MTVMKLERGEKAGSAQIRNIPKRDKAQLLSYADFQITMSDPVMGGLLRGNGGGGPPQRF